MAALRFVVPNGLTRLIGALGICVAMVCGFAGQATLAQDNPTEAKAVFTEMNDSGVTGFVSLVAEGDQTRVTMSAVGVLGDNPTHIHQGTCDDLDPNPQFPLTNIVLQSASLTGTSETVVDVPLADLLATPHLVLVHKSAKDIGTYLACGNIKAGALTAEQKAQMAAGVAGMPNTGVGTVTDFHTGRTTWLALVAAELLVLTALVGVRRARGPNH
jgi:hypothetical protein